MFYQSFMDWINYYIKQYSVSLIMHTSVPYPRVVEHSPDAMNHTGWLYFDTVICLLQSPCVLYFCALSGKLFTFLRSVHRLLINPEEIAPHLVQDLGSFCKDGTRLRFSSTAPDICLQVNSFLRSFFLSRQAPTLLLYAVMILYVCSIISTVYGCVLYKTSTL